MFGQKLAVLGQNLTLRLPRTFHKFDQAINGWGGWSRILGTWGPKMKTGGCSDLSWLLTKSTHVFTHHGRGRRRLENL
jgi:hypothetical protein